MFKNWSVARKTSAGFGAVVIVMTGVVLFNLKASTEIESIFRGYKETARQTLKLGSYISNLYDARLAVFTYAEYPSEANAQIVAQALATVAEEQRKAAALFADGTQDATIVEQVGAEIAAFQTEFERAKNLEAQTSALITELQETAPAFEKSINGFLFTARITADDKSVDHGNAAILAFVRGLSEVRSYLATGDLKALEASGPYFAGARSEIESAHSHQKIRGGDGAGPAGSLKVIDAFRDLLAKIRVSVEARDAARQALGAAGPKLQQQYNVVLRNVEDRQTALGEQGDAEIARSFMLTIAITAGAILAALLLATLISRALARGILTQADAMSRLAQGELEVEIQGADRTHELGRMAKALTVFKKNALRMRELDAEKEAADQAAATARSAMMLELGQSFGSVVDAAVAGDFSARVSSNFADAELNKLAEGVNRLLETVDAGVAETDRVMSRVAEGDLGDRMNGRFDGAFAHLQANVNATIERLAELVAQIQTASGRIQTSVADITSGAQNLSGRAESQAASLEETNATMEEMSAMVQASTQNANDASALAGGAAQEAKQGGEVVGETVCAMERISESSTRIGEIVTVIDGIAFQTNLLALNAAVEAARAGDAGKGFAVVAAEVRTLAQRSAEAARDVKALIEESSGHVSDGVRLVGKTGDALEKIVGAISEAATTVNQISVASVEQATGFTEVSTTIRSMDALTQQNAEMADHSAASARALSKEADALAQLVRFFDGVAAAEAEGHETQAA